MEPTVIIVIVSGALLVGLALLLVLRRAGAHRYQDMDAPLHSETPSQFVRGEDLPPELVYDVRVRLEAGRKIEAIKRVREVTHWDLKEAKEYVESLAVPAASYTSVSRSPMAQKGVSMEALDRVRDLLARRQKIEAIKLVREVTHWGLKEAKDYVDALEASGGMAPSGNLPYGNRRVPTPQAEIPADVMRQVQDLVARRRKIEAIKMVREVTNWGLKEAKDFVDGLETSR